MKPYVKYIKRITIYIYIYCMQHHLVKFSSYEALPFSVESKKKKITIQCDGFDDSTQKLIVVDNV